MKSCVNEYLTGRGYSVNTVALTRIGVCDDWYANRNIDGFHVRENLNGAKVHLKKMNLAKRCCADDANLCEIVSVAPEEESASAEFIEGLLEDNRFDIKYREQLEKTSATGTVGAYIYLKNADYYQDAAGQITTRGGQICINYVDADCVIPLTVENGQTTECAFAVTNIVKGKEQTTLVTFTISESGNYMAETVLFNETGTEIKESYTQLQLGEVKPFAIMQVAEVNNLDNMDGYGLPKIYNNIPLFEAADLCFSILYGDLDKGDKLLFINELLACIQQVDGKATLTPKQQEVFILLGEKLPDQDSIIKEYNPEIRVDQLTKAFELVLSLVSMAFGYGTKKYSFENGQITTATEYIGERQDEMQELNKQRKQAAQYITDIVHAALWFSNAFQSTAYNTEEPLSIEFDDSYIEDKTSKLERMRADALSFPEIPKFKVAYIMAVFNIPEEEAATLVDGYEVEEEPED